MRRHAFAVATAAALLGLGLPALPASADVSTLYVDDRNPQCTDTGPAAGTQTSPYCSIQPAADAVQAGQTVQISPGYYLGTIRMSRSGLPGSPIVFTKGPATKPSSSFGTDVQITGSPGSPAQLPAIVLNGVHDVSWLGLQFFSTISISDSSRITFDRNYVGAPANAGVPALDLSGTGSDVTVSRNEFRSSPHGAIRVGRGVRNADITSNAVVASGGPGIAVDGATSTLVTNNTVSESCGQNIALTGSATGTVVENNITTGATATFDNQSCAAVTDLAEVLVSTDSAAGTTYDYNLVHADSGVTPYRWAGQAYPSAAALHTAISGAGHDLNGDPKLTATEDSVVTLGTDSPAIDSADANAPGLPDTDYLGRKPVDDPAVSNTGTGSGIRDRGAYELQSFSALTLTLGTATEGPAPLTVTATANPGGVIWPSPLTYTFDFGDGSTPVTSSSPTARHVYTVPGSYTASVRATDGTGFSRTDRERFPAKVYVGTPGPIKPQLHLVQVAPLPDDRIPVLPLTYAYDPSGTTSPYPIKDTSVDWGDNCGSGYVQHTYCSPGTHTVTLTVTDDHGDTASISQPLDVEYFASGFTPITPQRVMDTRDGDEGGQFWWPGAKLPGIGQKVLQIDNPFKGVRLPSATTAVVLNVTVVNPKRDGFLSVEANSLYRPTTSNLNFTAGQTVANLVTAPVVGGTVILMTNSDDFDVVVDVFGYYHPLSTDKFTAHTPQRLLDTRDPGKTSIGPGSSVDVQIAGANGVPADATAAVLNLTATGPTAPGYLTAYPTGSTRPGTSNLNFVAGQTIANQVIVPIGKDGKISVFNPAGNTDAVVDLFGYYSPSGDALYHPVNPSRLLDTRLNNGSPLGQGGTVGITGIPAGATSAVLNVTSTESDNGGYFTLYPHGIDRPLASNLNFTAGETIPNHVTVPVGQNNQVDLSNFGGHSHAIADLYGYFAK